MVKLRDKENLGSSHTCQPSDFGQITIFSCCDETGRDRWHSCCLSHTRPDKQRRGWVFTGALFRRPVIWEDGAFIPWRTIVHSILKCPLKNYLFLERMEGREKEGEKHQCVVASHTPPTGNLACNPGMCPDWESRQQLFGSQAQAQCSIHWATPARAGPFYKENKM